MLPSRIVLACCALSPALITDARAEEWPDVGHEPPFAEVVDRPMQASGSEHIHYAYAQVLNVQPAYEEVPVTHTIEHCNEHELPSHQPPRDAGGAVLGAIIGGVIGNQIGHDSSRQADAPTSAAIDREAEHGEDIIEERHCVTEQEHVTESRLAGYDVEYRYRGEVFVSRLDHHPGDRLRIRVAVAPAETIGAALTTETSPY